MFWCTLLASVRNFNFEGCYYGMLVAVLRLGITFLCFMRRRDSGQLEQWSEHRAYVPCRAVARTKPQRAEIKSPFIRQRSQ
jgi:hypothetical protein